MPPWRTLAARVIVLRNRIEIAIFFWKIESNRVLKSVNRRVTIYNNILPNEFFFKENRLNIIVIILLDKAILIVQ